MNIQLCLIFGILMFLYSRSAAAFRCWCENTIGCSYKREMDCPPVNAYDRVKSCIKILRDDGEVIRACGSTSDQARCVSNRKQDTTTCICSSELCNTGPAVSVTTTRIMAISTFFLYAVKHLNFVVN